MTNREAHPDYASYPVGMQPTPDEFAALEPSDQEWIESLYGSVRVRFLESRSLYTASVEVWGGIATGSGNSLTAAMASLRADLSPTKAELQNHHPASFGGRSE